MSKINVKSMLHNITENKYFSSEVKGIKINNAIKFIDEDVTVVLELNENKINLKRHSNEYNIYMPLELNKKTKGIYRVNNLGELNLELEATFINIKDKNIEIEYHMIIENSEIQKFNYKIDYEEM